MQSQDHQYESNRIIQRWMNPSPNTQSMKLPIVLIRKVFPIPGDISVERQYCVSLIILLHFTFVLKMLKVIQNILVDAISLIFTKALSVFLQ
jgi:hypothetical protein